MTLFNLRWRNVGLWRMIKSQRSRVGVFDWFMPRVSVRSPDTSLIGLSVPVWEHNIILVLHQGRAINQSDISRMTVAMSLDYKITLLILKPPCPSFPEQTAWVSTAIPRAPRWVKFQEQLKFPRRRKEGAGLSVTEERELSPCCDFHLRVHHVHKHSQCLTKREWMKMF